MSLEVNDFVYCWDESGIDELENGQVYRVSEVAKSGRVSLDILDDGVFIYPYHFNNANNIVGRGTEVVIKGESGISGEQIYDEDVDKQCKIVSVDPVRKFPIKVEATNNGPLTIQVYHPTQLAFLSDEIEEKPSYDFLNVEIDDETLRKPLINKAKEKGFRINDYNAVFKSGIDIAFDMQDGLIKAGERYEYRCKDIGPVSENWNEIDDALESFQSDPDITITDKKVEFYDDYVEFGHYRLFNEEIERMTDLMNIEDGLKGIVFEVDGVEDEVTWDRLKDMYDYQLRE